MGKTPVIKAVILSIVISITVFISRHINYPSEFWRIVFLTVVIFIEAFTVDKVVDSINKKK
ncbi:MAG: hypothetical protein IJG09_01080 [Methanobrevibacter sp.]|jgi:hypothetical protein|nr:hypothetical protein [Methanobrevibacter sp.]MBQ3640621.1 hypothetical protein [bacterium]